MILNSTVASYANADTLEISNYGFWIYSAGIIALLLFISLIFLPLILAAKNDWSWNNIPLIVIEPPSQEKGIGAEGSELRFCNSFGTISETDKNNTQHELMELPKDSSTCNIVPQNANDQGAAMTELKRRRSTSFDAFDKA